IRESVPAFLKYLRYIESRKDEKGLVHIGLGDWCHVGDNRPQAPLEVTDTIMCVDISEKAAFMFDAVGLTEERDYAQSVADSFRKAFRDNLIDFETMTVKGNCQTSQAMSIFYGIFREDEKKAAFDNLLKYIRRADDHIDVGVLGGRVIFHVLSDFGYSDLAFRMITRPDYPSYGNWIARGATTLWENFSPDSVASPNHHFWGDVSAWFIKRVAGLVYNPAGNDVSSLRISPAFIGALQNAEAYYISSLGRIEVSWNRAGGNIILKVRVPEKINAEAVLPEGYLFEDGTNAKAIKTGEHIIKAE
ncbi:MAG: hypothetical protein J5850_00205, partial [Clostridia bacterium]|nr:hypothetical protein [Clostridia bacterium]